MDLLKFFTAGNVDDGKSTLIGRLLFDSNAISTDIIETLTQQSKKINSNTGIDLAMLTDGLRAEREQGITIDVAYKYFTTVKRKFIIADTPGHLQYTRNMFTGASNANLAIILVDARNGITDQTKRHTIISSILGIQNIVVCINKMDLVDYSEKKYGEIRTNYLSLTKQLPIRNIAFIPVSALEGDNVVLQSTNMTWYSGNTLLEYLETVEIFEAQKSNESRFQVQYVIRPQGKEFQDYRGFAGSILSGTYQKGQQVTVLPLGIETFIDKIELNQKEVEVAEVNAPVVLHLKDAFDIGRGTTIVPSDNLPKTKKEFNATICWMDHTSYIPGQKIMLQHNSFKTKAIISEVVSKIDIHSYAELESDGIITLNDLCKVVIKTADLISFDSYLQNKIFGSFILINENTNNTIAAGIID
jgi:sulfate adenylyltransferase subunit 1